MEMSSTSACVGSAIIVASVGLFQELCPRKTIPNYAKRVDVQIPQLNDEGEVIEVKDKEQNKRRKSKVCWRLFAFHGRCSSVFGEEGLVSEDSTVNVELLCASPTPAFGLPHGERFRDRACSAPSNTRGSLGGIPKLLPRPRVSPVTAQPWGQGPSCHRIKGTALRASIYATEHSLGTTPD